MSTKRLYGTDTSYLKLYELPNGYQFVSRKNKPVVEGNNKPDAVVVIARDDNGRLLVIRERRPVVGDYIWALPAGLVDEGETAFQAAAREIKEETGLTLLFRPHTDSWFDNTFSSPGLTDEKLTVITGTVSGKLSQDNLMGDEDITPYLLGPDDMQRLRLDHPQTKMSIWLALAANSF